jgi:hypothetical protein
VRLLQSPRRRRRLIFFSIAALVGGALIALGIHYSTPGSSGEANGPNVNDSFYDKQKHVPFKRTDQRKVHRILAQFISSAVARHDVGKSYDIAGPDLREGLSRKQWTSGDIPVTPYPASKHGQGAWDVVQYSYPKQVGLEVIIFPRPGSGYSIATADVDVVKAKPGKWLVNYFMIKKFHGPPSVAKASAKKDVKTAAKAKRRTPPAAAAEPDIQPPAPDHTWLILPIALLAMALVVPIVIGTIVWVRNRRAANAYYRSR